MDHVGWVLKAAGLRSFSDNFQALANILSWPSVVSSKHNFFVWCWEHLGATRCGSLEVPICLYFHIPLCHSVQAHGLVELKLHFSHETEEFPRQLLTLLDFKISFFCDICSHGFKHCQEPVAISSRPMSEVWAPLHLLQSWSCLWVSLGRTIVYQRYKKINYVKKNTALILRFRFRFVFLQKRGGL